MSRVFKDQKHVNMPKRDGATTGPSKIKKSFGPNADFRKVKSLSDWLYLKYDMSYKTFMRKSKNRKDALRAEYFEDTGRTPDQSNRPKHRDWDDDFNDYDEEWIHEDVLSHFYDIGVPISEDGTPLGIGWDD